MKTASTSALLLLLSAIGCSTGTSDEPVSAPSKFPHPPATHDDCRAFAERHGKLAAEAEGVCEQRRAIVDAGLHVELPR